MDEFDEIRKKLRDDLNEISERNEGVRDVIRRKDPAGNLSFEEQGAEGEFDDVMESLGDRTRGELIRIWDALQRIERGTYGQCSQCGRKIALERLKAMPSTELCVECAAKMEAG